MCRSNTAGRRTNPRDEGEGQAGHRPPPDGRDATPGRSVGSMAEWLERYASCGGGSVPPVLSGEAMGGWAA